VTFEALARMHAVCFTQAPRPWSASEFQSLLSSPQVYLIEETQGFAVFRIAGPEAELLTVAVHPVVQRQGIASKLVQKMHKHALKTGVQEVFLEVSEENAAGIALYLGAGYESRAIRKGYYNGPNGKKTNAIVMAKVL